MKEEVEPFWLWNFARRQKKNRAAWGHGWVKIGLTKLPMKSMRVLCFCFEDDTQPGNYERSELYDNGKEIVHLFTNDNGRYISVTHWMLMPQPPEE